MDVLKYRGQLIEIGIDVSGTVASHCLYKWKGQLELVGWSGQTGQSWRILQRKLESAISKVIVKNPPDVNFEDNPKIQGIMQRESGKDKRWCMIQREGWDNLGWRDVWATNGTALTCSELSHFLQDSQGIQN